MLKILVADQIADEGLAALRARSDISFEIKTGLSPDALGKMVGEFDGLIIRSGVKVTREALASPGKLRVIARAGVGVDNVDVPAATAAGVLVMNTPDANTVSTAEHAIAMILAAMRGIAGAHSHVIEGKWERKQFMGRQVAGKTLGIVGLGRVGCAVARRALGLDMTVVAFDPLLSAESAMDGRVRLVRKLEDLLPLVDVLTLHASMSAESKKMIGKPQLERMKPGAVLVNCARGALLDEAAVAEALNAGRLGGAAIDVFSTEPPAGNPLLTAKNVVLTPHLGASTEEAQTAVSTEAVESILDYLTNGVIRGAVNVTGMPANLSARDRAYMDLTARMGTILSPLCAGGVERIELVTQGGDALTALCPTLALTALTELMSPHIEGRLNLVNAADFAKDRGIVVGHTGQSARRDYYEVVTLKIARGNESHTIEGAVFQDGLPRILSIDGYRMEIVPEGLLVQIFNDDQPGVIGLVGTFLGDHKINIADMTLSRRGRLALMLLKIDGELPDAVLDALRAKSPPILSVRAVQLAAVGV